MDIPQQKATRLNLARTPGGDNFYGSTPGGTRIVYSKNDLLSLASSPLAKTPPTGLDSFPAAMSRADTSKDTTSQPKPKPAKVKNGDDTTFEMDD